MKITTVKEIQNALDAGYLVLTTPRAIQVGEVDATTGEVLDMYSDVIEDTSAFIVYEQESPELLSCLEIEDVIDFFQNYSKSVYEFECSLYDGQANPYEEITLLETSEGEIIWELDEDYSYAAFKIDQDTFQFFQETRIATFTLVQE